MLTVFWNPQEVLLAHFQKHGKNVNSASYCEVLLKLPNIICGKRPGQLARRVLLHHDKVRPHIAQVTRREFKNYSGNFLNICLIGLTWPQETSIWLIHWKTTWSQRFRWWRRGWNGGAEMAEETVKRLICCGFWSTGKAIGQVYQCQWRICCETNVFSRSKYDVFYVLYPFVTHLPTVPCNQASHHEDVWWSEGIVPPFLTSRLDKVVVGFIHWTVYSLGGSPW
jgi:hypothetical protein